MSKYKLLEHLGSGAFGEVHKAVEFSTNKIVAIKKVGLCLDCSEVMILQIIGAHNNVVQYIEYFTDQNSIYIVLEYCHFGSIDNFLKHNPSLDKNMRMRFLKDVSNGLAHIHGVNIVHRDLKPANILIDNRLVAKIADFGLAKVLNYLTTTVEEKYMKTRLGTLPYMAPEVLQGHYDANADIFSMGIIFCGILDDNLKEQVENELIGVKMCREQNYIYNVPPTIGPFMESLVTRMLQKDYRRRPTALDISQKLMQHFACLCLCHMGLQPICGWIFKPAISQAMQSLYNNAYMAMSIPASIGRTFGFASAQRGFNLLGRRRPDLLDRRWPDNASVTSSNHVGPTYLMLPRRLLFQH
ncbi:serine/threonine-protein kinase Aurora-3-like [Anneissia japonica]|uniref:serine/threonine-protein kinase Aurora-3-like n=1 Tax=Anneissia japonica TaxID=1529436 RepID=UPI001425627B|nr:serine/threonine-protein kinase Aurora-3-like [Anneissia japonica]